MPRASNRLQRARSTVGTAAFLYDANGNLRQRGQQGLTFDIGNRLLGSSFGTGHLYDGHGRRTWTQHGDGSWRLQMYSSAGRLMYARHLGPPDVWTQGRTLYLYIQDRLVAEYRPDAAQDWLQFVHTDALGTPVVRSGAAAPAQEIENSRRWFRPHGFTPLMPNTSEVGYTGHFYDSDTTLVYMQQRYYDNLTGRFLSVDPVVTDASNGSFFNRYVYANNNPYKYKDPDGRAFETAWDVASLVLSVGQFAQNPSLGNALGVVVDAAAVALPGIPGGVGALRAASNAGDMGKSAAAALPQMKGMGAGERAKTLGDAGFQQTKVSSGAGKNETWSHADGSQVRVHPYGNQAQGAHKSGNNAHLHKQDPQGNQLNDRGAVSTDKSQTHIGVPNPKDFEAVRGRQNGS